MQDTVACTTDNLLYEHPGLMICVDDLPGNATRATTPEREQPDGRFLLLNPGDAQT
jgi:hypothetical protein